MKIVLITFCVLLILSLGYLYTVSRAHTTSVPTEKILVFPEHNEEIESQCTSTACMSTHDDEKPLASEKVSVPTVSPHVLESEVVEAPKVAIEPSATKVNEYTQYIDFVDPSGFVNSEEFRLADYVGEKVIVLEFITYSCINCQRTFPYLQQWYDTYKSDGLLVVGIHTPEFSFERDRENVIDAMQKEGITFPVVMDNDRATWRAYGNRYWPRRYVIDYDGNIVFDHIGEGAYEETEAVIKLLLENKPDSL